MNDFDIRLCIKFLTCMGSLPQLDSDEAGAVSGVKPRPYLNPIGNLPGVAFWAIDQYFH